MKSLLFFIPGCLWICFAHAQTGTVSGKLADTLHKSVLAMATVQVRRAADSTLVTYRLSNATGDFKVPGLPLGVPLRLTITYTGFLPLHKAFTIAADKPVLDLGKLNPEVTSKQLDEVIIRSEVPPVVMRNDTMEFNADAFKTLPEAVLQDLLQKLPGVSMDTKGKLTANGKPVNKITVDGKIFFGDDPSIALQNLPANVIDKVQVLDDTEQKQELNGEHKEKLGKVINIKLKKNVKKGLFGKAYAGGGTDQRYQAGGIVNSFRDTLQISALAFANNVNQEGFSVGDVQSMGGLGRGSNGVGIYGDSYMYVGDINIGSTDYGIRNIKAGGVNVNYDLGKELSLNGKYFLSDNDNQSKSLSNSQQTIGDTILYNHGTSSNYQSSMNHQAGFKVAGKRDSTFVYRYTPSFSAKNGHSVYESQSNSSNNFAPQLTDGHYKMQSKTEQRSYRHDLSLFYYFPKHKGMSLSFMQNFSVENGHNDDTVNNTIHYYLTGKNTVLDQYKHTMQQNINIGNQLSYTLSVTKKSHVSISFNSGWVRGRNALSTYDRDTVSHSLSALNPAYSNQLYRDEWNNKATVSYRLEIGDLNLGVSADWATQQVNTDFGPLYPGLKQHLNNILPGFNLEYKGFNLYYNRSVDLPNASDIQPVPDIANPLYVKLGNADLKPRTRDALSMYYWKSWGENSFNFYVNPGLEHNATIQERTVDAPGAQVSRSINVNGTGSINSWVGARILLHKDQTWRLFVNGGWEGSFTKTVISVNNARSDEWVTNLEPSAGVEMNWNDKFVLSPKYSLNLNRSSFKSNAYPSQETTVHNASLNTVLRVPKNFVWESNITYRFNSTVSPGVSKNNYVWNASFSYLFGKDHGMQVKAAVFDLLNQRVNLWRSVRENYISDYQNTVLQRYGMLSFVYNIRGFRTK